ncbi:hypothetical protein O4J56_25195 [Nocardiopsis sp. RSe5-2]|uniref:Uncharacterized protein n=1 Tax=Nocardiopsis endophytica TaxID=3018445 RepID=A0ABT4UB41_9ACTN|nr:hypothetical protein [Nocardiopsis endophytica]MDA2813966.1 hypothetical protein [Nocardiopsis endophytica]
MRYVRGTVRAWAAVLAAVLAAVAVAAAAAPGPEPGPGPGPEGGTVDGFAIGHVPAALAEGAEVEASEYSYTWGGVDFTARTWERALADGGFRVELQVLVMRAASLTGPEELREFLAEYHERDAREWELEEFDHLGSPGFMGAAEAFWLEDEGVAVEVRDSAELLGRDEVRRTALGITREEVTGSR